MIKTLLSMHDIKYVISVDDCFFARKKEDMQAILFGQMRESLEPFRSFLSSSSQKQLLDDIDAFLASGNDIGGLLEFLLENLEYDEIHRCYEISEQNGTTYTSERDDITAFLQTLKDEGTIESYQTFPSTALAENFDYRSAGMTDGAILWLLDRNFNRVGESEEAGLVLAENILKRDDGIKNYIYILSAIEPKSGPSEDDIEIEFDKILATHCSSGDVHSLIYYISKQRIHTNDSKKIAKSLAQGFKRKACFELFQLFNDCLFDGLSHTSSTIQQIRQKTLNYLFYNKASSNGEPYTEVAARLVQIFYQDEYNKAIAQRHLDIAEKACYYETLCTATVEKPGNEKDLTATLKAYRDLELYNKHINAQFCEVATGDIFKIDSSYYLLVSQACDTCLRDDGHRTLKYASLLEIQDNKQAKYSYPLSCFLDMSKPAVMYRSLKTIPFDVLDLCAFNVNGKSMIVLNDIADFSKELSTHSNNYRIRFGEVLSNIKRIHGHKKDMDDFLSGKEGSSAEHAKRTYAELENVDPCMKKYDTVDFAVSFPVQRIARLNELITIDIVKEYGTALTRIGHPFDFTSETTQSE